MPNNTTLVIGAVVAAVVVVAAYFMLTGDGEVTPQPTPPAAQPKS